ncbi:MAG: hypothetical protein FWD06_04960 [Oscillospiraceae bacterium]|nr:hypothetical protein [Oscillospiraceae bacterium]
MKRYDKECPTCRVMCQFEDGADETTCLYCGGVVPAYDPVDTTPNPKIVFVAGLVIWPVLILRMMRNSNAPELAGLLVMLVPMLVWCLIFLCATKRVPRHFRIDIAKYLAVGAAVAAVFFLLWYFGVRGSP